MEGDSGIQRSEVQILSGSPRFPGDLLAAVGRPPSARPLGFDEDAPFGCDLVFERQAAQIDQVL